MMALIFIAAAAFFNACMDAFENENFHESIFRTWNQKFWYKRESWRHAWQIFGYKVDAWHLAKTGMICCVALAFVFNSSQWPWYIQVAAAGGIWNLVFILFYHKIFKIK